MREQGSIDAGRDVEAEAVFFAEATAPSPPCEESFSLDEKGLVNVFPAPIKLDQSLINRLPITMMSSPRESSAARTLAVATAPSPPCNKIEESFNLNEKGPVNGFSARIKKA